MDINGCFGHQISKSYYIYGYFWKITNFNSFLLFLAIFISLIILIYIHDIFIMLSYLSIYIYKVGFSPSYDMWKGVC